MSLTAIDHVKLALPRGREGEARAVHGGVLGHPIELMQPLPRG